MDGQSSEVDAYLGNLPRERRAALAELRALVSEVVPGAVETFKYRMPTYECEGKVVCSFASQKHYMSLYIDPEVVDRHKADLAGLSTGKSCIRFKRLASLPTDTVRQMLHEVVQKGGSE